MGDRFYLQRDNLDISLQKIPPAHRRPKGTIPTYYLQMAAQKVCAAPVQEVEVVPLIIPAMPKPLTKEDIEKAQQASKLK
jgi:hypothetical protein